MAGNMQKQLDDNKDFIMSIGNMSYDKILDQLSYKGIVTTAGTLKRWFEANGGKPTV